MSVELLRFNKLHPMLLLLLCLGTCSATASGDELTQLASAMNALDTISELEGNVETVAEGPAGATVLRAESAFSGRVDLKARGIEPGKFDLIKLDIKADARASVQLSLENYPQPGLMSHWYLYSKARGAFDWETAWIDLRRPEEIKAAGRYKGLENTDPSLRGLRIAGFVGQTHRSVQPPGRRIWLGPVRFVRQAVHLDWDQQVAPYRWGRGKDLVFRYPLQVTNRLRQPVTASLKLVPLDARDARAKLSRETVELAPGASAVVDATLALPASVAATKSPLYCERFLAVAAAEGFEDSLVTILRSSDPVPLTITIPVDDAKLRFPLLTRRKDIPEAVTGFQQRNRATAMELADMASPQDLYDCLGRHFVVDSGAGLYSQRGNEASRRYLDGLTAAAFLYDLTRDDKYLRKGTDLLMEAAQRFPPLQEMWQREQVVPISNGIIAINTLRLGWATGSMRAPYHYQRHGMFNDFDLLAAGMHPKDRTKILENLLLPAGIQMRNHTFGLGNQQDVVNYAILYAGLATRNWPLVSFAYSSDYGIKNQIAWDFDDDGLAGEGHYHTPAVRPILYTTELLSQVGVDLYDQRLHLITHSPAADAIGKSFRDAIRDYVDEHRFKGKQLPSTAGKTDGVHLSSGITSLRWDGLGVSMNWGKQIHRGAHDRCCFRIDASQTHPLHRIGGGNYSHSSLGQSILIIDEELQDAVPAHVTGYDIEGPVQFVQAESDRHYPGATITRTFAILERHVLAIDHVESDQPRTVDWCLRYAGGNQTHEDVARRIALAMKHRKGSFTDKPGVSARGVNYGRNLKSSGHFSASTDAEWHQDNGKMTMAACRGTDVLVFAVPAAFSAWKKERETGVPVLMARRKNVERTEFVAVFSDHVKHVQTVPVETPGGGRANAIGVKLQLADGRTIHAIANFEPQGVAVQLGKLKTNQRFATDYADN